MNIKDITPLALSLGIAILVIALFSLILANFVPSTYTATAVTNETHNSSGTVPETLTASYIQGGIVSGSGVIYINDVETGTSELLTVTTNYTEIDVTAGTFNITSCPLANGTSDTYNLSYTYKATGNASYVVTKGLSAMTSFADWFAVIVIVGVAIIILGLVMLLRSARGSSV